MLIFLPFFIIAAAYARPCSFRYRSSDDADFKRLMLASPR